MTNLAEAGAGIDVDRSDVLLNGCTVRNNIAYSQSPSSDSTGGGIRASSSSLTIRDSTFEGNVADHGGGIYAVGSDLTLRATRMQHNRATGAGGAIAGLICELIRIDGSSLLQNQAERGGGFFVVDSVVDVLGSAILGNEAEVGGGGILLLTSQLFELNPPDFWLRSASSAWLNIPSDVESPPSVYDIGSDDFACWWEPVLNMVCE